MVVGIMFDECSYDISKQPGCFFAFHEVLLIWCLYFIFTASGNSVNAVWINFNSRDTLVLSFFWTEASAWYFPKGVDNRPEKWFTDVRKEFVFLHGGMKTSNKHEIWGYRYKTRSTIMIFSWKSRDFILTSFWRTSSVGEVKIWRMIVQKLFKDENWMDILGCQEPNEIICNINS